MSRVRRFDHVGITVADLATAVTAFFVGLGLEVEGTRTFIEGEFLDTVIGIPTPVPRSSFCAHLTEELD